jgi:hypothetical protein
LFIIGPSALRKSTSFVPQQLGGSTTTSLCRKWHRLEWHFGSQETREGGLRRLCRIRDQDRRSETSMLSDVLEVVLVPLMPSMLDPEE